MSTKPGFTRSKSVSMTWYTYRFILAVTCILAMATGWILDALKAPYVTVAFVVAAVAFLGALIAEGVGELAELIEKQSRK
jgi:hypothetical protein